MNSEIFFHFQHIDGFQENFLCGPAVKPNLRDSHPIYDDAASAAGCPVMLPVRAIFPCATVPIIPLAKLPPCAQKELNAIRVRGLPPCPVTASRLCVSTCFCTSSSVIAEAGRAKENRKRNKNIRIQILRIACFGIPL